MRGGHGPGKFAFLRQLHDGGVVPVEVKAFNGASTSSASRLAPGV